MGMKGDAVPTGVPISDADGGGQQEPEFTREERLRLVEERKNPLPCTLVCDDGLYPGKALTVHCVGVWSCLNAGSCFWRWFHEIPPSKQRKNCDVALDD